MARQRRLNLPGAIYHVITRGLNRAAIFKDRADRDEFLTHFSQALEKTACRCYAWVLMPNHLHLLIHTSNSSLSSLMKKALTGYAMYFNHRYKRCGYLFQNRYKSILCQEEVYLLELVRYIHLNPVRAGIVKTMSDLDNYPWTGHSVIMGKRKRKWQSLDEILGRFGMNKKQAIAGYRKFIQDGWLMGKRKELSGGEVRRTAGGGWSTLLEMWKNKEYIRGDERILGDEQFVVDSLKCAEEELIRKDKLKRLGWNIDKLAVKVCSMMNVNKVDLQKRGRKNRISIAKGIFAYWGNQELGLSGVEIGQYLGMSGTAAGKAIETGKKYTAEKGLKILGDG